MNEIKSLLRQESRMAHRTLKIYNPSEYLFYPGRNRKKHYTENRLRQIFRKYVITAGLDREYGVDKKGRVLHELTVHSLRHYAEYRIMCNSQKGAFRRQEFVYFTCKSGFWASA